MVHKDTAKSGRRERRELAGLRKTDRAARSPRTQLEELDRRLGEGMGAVKERARLARQLKGKPKQAKA